MKPPRDAGTAQTRKATSATRRRHRRRELTGATLQGDLDTVRTLLLDQPGDVNTRNEDHGETLLILACMSGHRELVGWLLVNGADTEARTDSGRTAIMWCSAEIASLLLDAGANVNAADDEGQTALMFAVMAASLERVELLLSRGADRTLADSDGTTASDIAYNYGLGFLLKAPGEDSGTDIAEHQMIPQ